MAERIHLTIDMETGPKRIAVDAGEDWAASVIGRGRDADIFLNDPSVSRRHCRIFRRPRSIAVEDLGSTAGTYRNGERVTRAIGLADGDVLQVGTLMLRVEIAPDDVSVREAAEAERTIVGSQPLSPPPPAAAPPPPPAAPPPPVPAAPPPAAPAAPVLGDRTTVVGPGVRIGTRKVDLVIPLAGRERIVLGRGTDCDVTLDHPTISRRHAGLLKRGAEWTVQDLGSSNGTFVTGEPVVGVRALAVGDALKVGPYHLTFDGVSLASKRLEEGTRIEVRDIGKVVTHRETGKPLWLLKGISLTIQQKEFVGLLGSSGCGKSTFMDTVNGRRPASEGAVLYNDENLYNRFDAFKRGIGYVPQELIFHEELPLADALRYASKLRLPEDVTDEEIEKNIDRVLGIVGLVEQRGTLITNLSGGQKKRVSIAMELLSRPTLLFLDEATSGLDLGTEAQMMKLFRGLADGGVTTMCITHYVDSLEQCDVVAYFVKGRLAFFGPPGELKAYFGVSAIREVYVKETERTPEEWEQAYLGSEAYRRYVKDRAAPTQQFEATMVRPGQVIETVKPANPMKQFGTLLKRYVQVLVGDRRGLVLSLVLAPIIAILLSLVFQKGDDEALQVLAARQGKLIFVLTVVTIFLGVFSSIREVVKELPIYRHERFVNLEILPYLASKALPLGIIGAIQVLELLIVTHIFTDLHGNGALQFFVLFPVVLASMLLGLMISTAVNTADKAILLMILAVIPQILFANAIQALGGFGKMLGMVFILAFWSHDGMRSTLPGRLDDVLKQTFDGTWDVLNVFMILVFASIYAFLAYFALVKKDGPYGKHAIPFLRSGAWVEVRTRLGWAFRKGFEGAAWGITRIRQVFSSLGSGGGQPPPPMARPPGG